MKQFDDQKTLEENVIENILTRGSVLYSEVEFLIRQELRETSTYNIIIEAVAMGNTRLNDIYQKTQIEKTKLSVYLANLIELGILCREFSVDAGVKEQANVQRGLYQVTDCFFKFWYAYVFPNYSELESGDSSGIWEYVIKPDLDHYISHAFEDICRNYLRKQNRKNLLPFHFTKIGRWWNKMDELDVLALNAKKDKYILGECKFKNSKFALSDFKHMQGKFKPKEQNTKLYYFLFSKAGFTDDVIKECNNYDITLITPDILVEQGLSRHCGANQVTKESKNLDFNRGGNKNGI